MNRLKFLMPVAGMMLLGSCSQEEIVQQKDPSKDNSLAFRVGMGTRVNSAYNYTEAPSPFYATAFKGKHTDASPSFQFQNIPFTKQPDGLWASTNENAVWPEGATEMEFFAYAPSINAIKNAAKNNGVDDTTLGYIQFYNVGAVDPVNNGTFDGATDNLQAGYKLGRFYVAKDIDQQVDFITAHTAGATENIYTSVPLRFYHELSNIELRAFSGSNEYDVEIAGVRIGGAYTGRAIFNFCADEGQTSSEGGRWGFPNDPQRLTVEYIYGDGDETYKMSGKSDSGIHNSKAKAESIMGAQGGNAMVLPTVNKQWEGTANPWISPKYNTDDTKNPLPWGSANGIIDHGDAYFSILVRVTTKTEKKELIYPYPNGGDMNTVSIYKDKTSGKVKGNSVKTTAQPDNTDAVKFGWVCVPVDFNWLKGYHYIYTLDFSEGLGVQDPEDPEPGTPILGKGIKFSVTLEPWQDGFSDEDGKNNEDVKLK